MWAIVGAGAVLDAGDLVDAGAERNAVAAIRAVVGPAANIAARGTGDADFAALLVFLVPTPICRAGLFVEAVAAVFEIAAGGAVFVEDAETAIGMEPE